MELRLGVKGRGVGRRETSWEAVIVIRVETMVLWTRVVAVVKNRVIWHGSFRNGTEQKKAEGLPWWSSG